MTIFETIERAAVTRPDAGIRDEDSFVPFSSLTSAVRTRAGVLSKTGIGPGDRVLVALENSTEWVRTVLAIMRLGAIAAPVNPHATPKELDSLEAIVGSRCVVGHDNRAEACQSPPAKAGDEEPDPGESWLPALPDEDAPALILFTSGTTGTPKAAVLSHKTLAYAGAGFAHWLQLTAHDRLLACMPLHHANGIYYSLMGSLVAASDLYIARRFSVSKFWELVKRTGSTEVNLMGPMLGMLLSQPANSRDRDHPLRLVYTAAAPAWAAQEFVDRFGVEVVEGYALTETPYGCINPIGRPPSSSVGRPRQHPERIFENEVRIWSGPGAEAKEGEIGEIQIRNGATFSGYWNDPAATAAAFDQGWLRTGDLGRRDAEGFFHVVGRSKEVIRRNGVNIMPREVENALMEIPDVDEVAVVGLPSNLGEESVVAVATLKKGVPRGGAETRIQQALERTLSREKVPNRIVVVDELPKTHTHRVAKAQVKEWLQAARPKAIQDEAVLSTVTDDQKRAGK